MRSSGTRGTRASLRPSALGSAAMCRALKVLCVTSDAESLAALKRAAVSAEWELAPGAVDEPGAIEQMDAERPQIIVVFGDYAGLIALARDRFPSMRIICDRDLPGANVVASSLEEVRRLVLERPR